MGSGSVRMKHQKLIQIPENCAWLLKIFSPNILVYTLFVLEESTATDAESTSDSSPESRFLFQILHYTASMLWTWQELYVIL